MSLPTAAGTARAQVNIVRADERFPALDAVRAVGALMVVLTHVGFQSGPSSTGSFSPLLARLDVGVAIFFVISGFLLFRPHVVAYLSITPRPSTRTYLRHRVLRIFPVVCIATATAALLTPSAGASAAAYLEHAALVHIYSSNELLVGLTQMWSLATEVAFYLVLPLLATLLCRGRRDASWVRRTLISCTLIALIAPIWMVVATNYGSPQARLWLPGFLGWFTLGMGLAVFQVADAKGILCAPKAVAVASRPGTVWALAAGILLISTTPVAGPFDLGHPTAGQAWFKAIAYSVVGVLCVLPVVLHRPDHPVLRILGGRVCRYLGSISYGIFAYHVIVLALIERYSDITVFTGHFWQRLVVTLLVTVPIATVSFYGVERPIMRWGRRRDAARANPAALGPAQRSPREQRGHTPARPTR